ncbi:MAG TPA: hypothetical protein VHT28_15430, partial [Silvibacterium sp.]|nr:hypothetical protein [Silvibacterium sp.]
FFSVLFAGGAVASLCLSSFAQTANSGAPAPQQPTNQTSQQQTAPATPAAPLKLENLPPDPHTPTPEELAAEEAARQRAQIVRVASAQANWGPKASSPGMALAMKEMARTKTASGTQITYRLIGTGFTPGVKLTLLRWPLNQNVTPVMDGIVLDASGMAVCAGPAPVTNSGTDAAPAAPSAIACSKTVQANAPVEVTTVAAKGEAVRVALVAEDKKGGAAASAIPFPLAAEDRGCKLQVVLGSKDAEMVLIEGDGLKQGEPFTMGSETFGVKGTLTAKPDAQGHLVTALTPYVQGHDSGDTVLFYQSDTCTPTLSFHWGKGSYKAE